MRSLLIALVLCAFALPVWAQDSCEVVICGTDRPGEAGDWRWSRGDPIVAGECGTNWGNRVMPEVDERRPRRFYIVTLTDKSAQQVNTWIRDCYEDVDGDCRMLRAYKFLLDNIPVGVRQELVATGRYRTSWAQIKAYIRHKITDEEPEG